MFRAIATMLAFLALTSFASAEVVCHYCGEQIEGRYMQYRAPHINFIVCQDCNQNLPRCESCNIPHTGDLLTLQKGERLCTHCAKHAKYCEICDHRIEGRYYQLSDGEGEEHLYCQRCYAHSRKCAVCYKPTPLNRLDAASGACLDCVAELPTCKSCGRKITGSYFEYQFADGKFCSDCRNHKPECYICNVPVGKTYWEFPDGRTLCEGCHEDVIIDGDTIRSIMNEVEGLIEKHLGLTLERDYKLNIVTSNNLLDAQRAKHGKSTESPLHGRELGLYRYANGQSEIFLLYGLPAEMLYETAAHEWAHAWQIENAPPNQSLLLKEGFAQWVAAQILRIKGFEQGLVKLEARNDYPYGRGYKRFKSVETNLDRQSVIEYAQKQVR